MTGPYGETYALDMVSTCIRDQTLMPLAHNTHPDILGLPEHAGSDNTSEICDLRGQCPSRKRFVGMILIGLAHQAQMLEDDNMAWGKPR